MPRLPSKNEIVSLKHSKLQNKDKVLTAGIAMEVGRRRNADNKLDASTRWSLTAAQQSDALKLNDTMTELGEKLRWNIEPVMSRIRAIGAMFPSKQKPRQKTVKYKKILISYDPHTGEIKLPVGTTIDFSDAPHAAALLRILFSNKRTLGQLITWKHILMSPRSRQILENVGVTKSSQLRRTKAVINKHFPDGDFLTGNHGAKVNSKYKY